MDAFIGMAQEVGQIPQPFAVAEAEHRSFVNDGPVLALAAEDLTARPCDRLGRQPASFDHLIIVISQ
jgi:hypothetical protein